jgi:hypothetical protein
VKVDFHCYTAYNFNELFTEARSRDSYKVRDQTSLLSDLAFISTHMSLTYVTLEFGTLLLLAKLPKVHSFNRGRYVQRTGLACKPWYIYKGSPISLLTYFCIYRDVGLGLYWCFVYKKISHRVSEVGAFLGKI